MRSSWWTRPVAVLIGLAIVSCAQMEERERQRQKQFKEAVEVLDKSHIPVLADSNLGTPYRVLGKVEYREPVSAETIDEQHIKGKLRSLALERWPDDVDALVNTHSDVSEDGTEVIASAEAARVNPGPGIVCCTTCPLCRHKMSDEERAMAGIANQGPSAEREFSRPQIYPGATWVYQIDGKPFVVKAVERDGDILVLEQNGKRVNVNPDLNMVSGYSWLLRQDISYTPSLGTLQFPLKPGAKWERKWTFKLPEVGATGEGTTFGKAVEWEDVQVKAGIFHAIKLQIDYHSRMRFHMTCWYADEVNAFVRCDTSIPNMKHMELVGYSPNGLAASQ